MAKGKHSIGRKPLLGGPKRGGSRHAYPRHKITRPAPGALLDRVRLSRAPARQAPLPRPVRTAMVGLVALGIIAKPQTLTDIKPPTTVFLADRTVDVPPRTTMDSLFARYDIAPREGHVMSVLGRPLQPNGSPATVKLNGKPRPGTVRLRMGDRIEFQNGIDEPEPTVEETYPEADGNPQFLMGDGIVTVKRGVISNEVAPIATRPGSGVPRVAITFDDGPHKRYTPAILDILKRAGVKATFFNLGEAAAKNPDLVKREIDEGMRLGNHTWDHSALGKKPDAFVKGQLTRSRDQLSSLGAAVSVFRPPFGSFNDRTVAIAQSLGLRTVIWDVDSKDYQKPGAPAIIERVLSQAGPGSIILLHDGGGDRSQTVKALPAIIAGLKSRGFEFSVLG